MGTLETLGQVLGNAAGGAGGQQGQISVEVRALNTQQQVIQVATQEGQVGNVRYDANTVVTYQQQQYPVTALEAGDLAIMQVQDVQGTLYASRIDVQQSVQDRGGVGGGGNIVQLSGSVSQINHDAGTFVLRTQSGNLTVALPYNPPQATLNYFHALRNGSNVRLEARPLSNTRVEIYRFL